MYQNIPVLALTLVNRTEQRDWLSGKSPQFGQPPGIPNSS
jgi:hypothetical protein